MYGAILGFQKRVWCPKWTPASSISRMETDMGRAPKVRSRIPAHIEVGVHRVKVRQPSSADDPLDRNTLIAGFACLGWHAVGFRQVPPPRFRCSPRVAAWLPRKTQRV